jgi:hypothetical protein
VIKKEDASHRKQNFARAIYVCCVCLFAAAVVLAFEYELTSSSSDSQSKSTGAMGVAGCAQVIA